MLIREYLSWERIPEGYLIHADCADVKVICMTDSVIRLRVSFDRVFEEASYALVTTAWPDSLDTLFAKERRRIRPYEAILEEKTEELCFSTGKYVLVLCKRPFAFRLEDAEGNILFRDLPKRAYERDHLGRVAHYSCMDQEKDHFYGFGEKTGPLDKKGRRMRMNPKDAIGHDPQSGDPMYKHIPFYIRVNEDSGKAIGMFYHNSYDSVFDMGEEISGYWERYCYYQAEGGDIDLFLVAGEGIGEILENYTMLTGRMAMPPKSAMGFTASTMYYAELEEHCDEEILKAMEKQDKEKLWVSAFQLASGYSSGEEDNLRYVFCWNKKRFPDPSGFFTQMEDMGITVVPNVKPGLLPHHPYLEEFSKAGALIRTADGTEDYVGRWWGGEGRFVDFTSKAGREIWKRHLEEDILKPGAHVVWNDNCEYDGIEDREAKCSFEGFGADMTWLKCIQGNMMAYTAKQALEEVYPGERPFIVNRAGYAGIQRYAQIWGGDNLTDWRTVKYNVDTLVGMGLSGLADAGCDIGGFAGPAPGAELLLRWIQSGIFQPRFCMNSANSDNTVTQPWMYEELLPYVQQAFAQRYRMIPYLYSLMYEAHCTGKPVMRPLFLEFPEDRNCYRTQEHTFLFGPSVLVANVLEEGARTRRVYLPEGSTWYDMQDHFRPWKGGQTIEIPVGLGSIPMFLRDGAVYCTTEDIHHIQKDIMETLDVLVSAGVDSCFTLYDDDGHSTAYEQGEFMKLHIQVIRESGAKIIFTREGSYPLTVRKICLRLISREKGAWWAALNERLLPRFLMQDAWEEAEEGWCYNLSDRTVMVKFDVPQEREFALQVNTEKFDLIGMTKE